MSGKALNFNQKPLDMMNIIVEASSDENDVIWEPFGGLFSAALSARKLKMKAFSCEIDPDYFYYGVQRFNQ
ncbi:DNA methyltransferase [Microcoleus sp. Pol11C1]|uniref:DNA methyltransferase n=1 Tax=unclassified Microcoleus TaxID=2642155 RepID=UPI002FCF4549